VRQLAAVERLAARVEASPAAEGLLLLGSLARGEGDELSDVDAIVVVAEGRFDEAWAARHQLEDPDVLVAWDDSDRDRAGVGARKWLTSDIVLVECLLATPSSGVRLADPFRIVVGDRELPNRFTRRPAIERSELDTYVAEREAAGKRLHDIEHAYAALTRAVRQAR
jgi:predicted nucleotidyltransferase